MNIEETERENRLLQLDLAWQRERENYYFPNKARGAIPTMRTVLLIGTVSLFLTVTCIFLLWQASVKPILLIVFVAMNLFVYMLVAVLHTAAKDYEQARQRYEREHLRIRRGE